MSHYKIILDEEALASFVDSLDECSPEEGYYFTLFSRRKYSNEDIRSSHMIKEFTCKKSNIIDSIRQLECPLGCYKDKGVALPQDSLVLYMHINPKNLKLAMKNTAMDYFTCLTEGNFKNPKAALYSNIAKARGTVKYVDFDFDFEEEDENTLPDLIKVLNNVTTDYRILKTRGGYHVIVDVDKATKMNKLWYTQIKRVVTDTNKPPFTPIPGCTQGNFSPYFVQL